MVYGANCVFVHSLRNVFISISISAWSMYTLEDMSLPELG